MTFLFVGIAFVLGFILGVVMRKINCDCTCVCHDDEGDSK
jgi:hypothetical protein